MDEGEACGTMPNQPFSPGSRLSVWVRGAPCHRGLAHSSAQCPCQSRQHFLLLLAPALAGIHNISQLQTMACLPAPTIWLLWAAILTHITNYSKSREGVCRLFCDMWDREGKGSSAGWFSCVGTTRAWKSFFAQTFQGMKLAGTQKYIKCFMYFGISGTYRDFTR